MLRSGVLKDNALTFVRFFKKPKKTPNIPRYLLLSITSNSRIFLNKSVRGLMIFSISSLAISVADSFKQIDDIARIKYFIII